jgi:predicted esterase
LVLTFVAGSVRFPGASPARAGELGVDPAPLTDLAAPMQIAAPARVHAGANLQIDNFLVHIPPGAVEPLTPIVVLHGMGGAGSEFSELVQARCDAEHWMIIAPTFGYGDWRDPATLTRESTTHFARINAFLDRLPEIAGMSVRPQVFLYGFSRGAQAANRYALAYPERVAGVAMMSAGTYTLPLSEVNVSGEVRVLQFPFGVANSQELFGQPFDAARFARIPFWLGVGSRDNDPVDVPRLWDPYVGTNRLERAGRYAQWLSDAGMEVELRVFQGVGHGIPPETAAAAMDFIDAHQSGR